MIDKIKKIEFREDGFIEVHLKRIKDFDDYLYQQILNDVNCLPCIRDPKYRSRLYFDSKGYVSLKSYLGEHEFTQEELLDFLIILFERFVKNRITKPAITSLEYVYLSSDTNDFCFLVFPVAHEYWNQEKEIYTLFLQELLKELHAKDSYEVFGCLLCFMKEKESSFPVLISRLQQIKNKHKKKIKWYQKFKHREETKFQIRDIPRALRYPTNLQESLVAEKEQTYIASSNRKEKNNETIVLFQPLDTEECYFEDQDSGKKYIIKGTNLSIGRNPDNEMSIDDKSVSSYHAVYDSKKKSIKDLHSLNGTYCNGERIIEKQLQDNDVLTFGNSTYVFHDKRKG